MAGSTSFKHWLWSVALLPALGWAQSPVQQPPAQPAWVAYPRPATAELEDHRRISDTLGKLKPQRRGVVDAYVIAVALDADPVFGREAREAGRVLARRFDAEGRTLVLAEDEGAVRADAAGSPHHLALALARAAEVMDLREDVLVLYSTSHGERGSRLAYRDLKRGMGAVTPARLAQLLGPFRNRVVLLQACYSGQFVPALASTTSVIATAASATKPSFGCHPGNDWTFFGDALINRAFRAPAPLPEQLNAARETVAGWEGRSKLDPSEPQVSIGNEVGAWLAKLDARAPEAASAPVGRSPADEGR